MNQETEVTKKSKLNQEIKRIINYYSLNKNTFF